MKGWWKIRKGLIYKRYAFFAINDQLFLSGLQNIIDGSVLIEDRLFKQGLMKIFDAEYSFDNYAPDLFWLPKKYLIKSKNVPLCKRSQHIHDRLAFANEKQS